MDTETSPLTQLTPLRLAGGSCLAAAAGLAALAIWGGSAADQQVADTAARSQPAGNARLPAEAAVIPAMAPRPSIPQRGAEAPLPEGFPPLSLPASGQGAQVTYIVRIRDAAEVQAITRSYRRDRPAAISAWESLVAQRPGLEHFELAGASYSGELRLTYRLPEGVAPSQEAVGAVRDYLLAIDGVVYADPDVIAHPGKEKTE